MAYAIYLTRRDSMECGYLAANPGFRTSWLSGAQRFETEEEARAEITRRGFRNSTSVPVSGTNAYVVFKP